MVLSGGLAAARAIATGRWSGLRESDPCPRLGKPLYYHCTKPALRPIFYKPDALTINAAPCWNSGLQTVPGSLRDGLKDRPLPICGPSHGLRSSRVGNSLQTVPGYSRDGLKTVPYRSRPSARSPVVSGRELSSDCSRFPAGRSQDRPLPICGPSHGLRSSPVRNCLQTVPGSLRDGLKDGPLPICGPQILR